MAMISRAEDPVMIVKFDFNSFYPYAFGDLIRPAHNKSYQRPTPAHSYSAVPLGCGQLGSGGGWLITPLWHLTPAPCIVWIERLTFGHDRIGKLQQLARGCAACDL